MIDLSIAIQHTPDCEKRRQWVRAAVLQIQSENPEIVLSVIEDSNRDGCWPTYRRALKASGRGSHHLVLQDDVGLCKDFVLSVGAAIEARPENLLALYTNSQAVYTVRDRGEAWLNKSGASGPAVVWPRELIDEFLEWEEKHIDQSFEWDTVRVSMWLAKTSRDAFATVPSLIEHLGWNESTMGLNSPMKVATWFIGGRRSGVEIDWSRGLQSPIRDETGFRSEWWDYYRE